MSENLNKKGSSASKKNKTVSKTTGSGSKNTKPKSTKTSKTYVSEKKFGETIYYEIFILMLFLISLIVMLSLFTSVMGIFGVAVSNVLKGIFGAGAFVLPPAVMAFCVWTVFSQERRMTALKVIGIILFSWGISTLFQLITEGGTKTGESVLKNTSMFYKNATSFNGGVLGGITAWGLSESLGWGSYIIVFAIIIIAVMLGTGKSLFMGIVRIIEFFGERRKVKEAKIKAEAENIKEREQQREQRMLLKEEKLAKRLERKAQRKGIFNIILSEGKEGFPNMEGEIEKIEENQTFAAETIGYETPSIDISDVDFNADPPKLIEVLGVTEGFDENIPIFGLSEEEPVLEEAVIKTNEEEPYIEEVKEEVIKEVIKEVKEETKEEVKEDIEKTIEPEIEEVLQNNEIINKIDEKPHSDKVSKPLEISFKEEIIVEEEYVFPPIELLGQKPSQKSGEKKTDMIANAKKLEETLMSFGVEAKVTQINKGPTVTRYELAPSQGVKVSKIVNLADDIALNLAAIGIRIEAPIPGKAAVGIEVPNKETQSVYLRSVLESEDFINFPSKLAFALGEDITGKAIVTDIAKMPHLLIAGATGSGKSVCINTLITSIIYKADPKEVKLLLVDPKVVELSVYNGIPHLLIPVVTDPKKAAGALNWAVREMLLRYQSFAEHNVRDIKGYNNAKTENGEDDFMPQIVIVIDELADLMMAAPGEVEDSICRLAQMARAAGIHLIIATQRPSVDVITGVIKANIPSRLAFAVSSGIDSRTILDSTGAEKLLGKGDMLFYPVGMSKPVRIQGAFVTDKEVESIVEFVKKDRKHDYDQSMIDKITAVTKAVETNEESDELYQTAVEFVVNQEKASVSMLQRKFRIGYNRAARIMEDMEGNGIVSSEDGSKPRKVLITKAQLEAQNNPVEEEI